jgi:hypothetical protein
MSVRLRGGVGPVRVSVPLMPRGMLRAFVMLFVYTGVGVWLLCKFIYWTAPVWIWRTSHRAWLRSRAGQQP